MSMKLNHVLALFFTLTLASTSLMAQTNPGSMPSMETAPLVASINVNTASAEELADRLAGIGLVRAQAIIDYRSSQGRFASVDQLINVEGIGPSILENNRAIIRTE